MVSIEKPTQYHLLPVARRLGGTCHRQGGDGSRRHRGAMAAPGRSGAAVLQSPEELGTGRGLTAPCITARVKTARGSLPSQAGHFTWGERKGGGGSHGLCPT